MSHAGELEIYSEQEEEQNHEEVPHGLRLVYENVQFSFRQAGQ